MYLCLLFPPSSAWIIVGALYVLEGVILEGHRLISILTQWTGIGLRYLILYGKQVQAGSLVSTQSRDFPLLQSICT